MSDDRGGFGCTAVSWAAALGTGALIFVLLIGFGGWGFFGALFIAALVALGLGVLCQYVFCGTMGGGMTTPAAPRADGAEGAAQREHEGAPQDAASPRPIEAMVPAGAAAVPPAAASATQASPAEPAGDTRPDPADESEPTGEAGSTTPADQVSAESDAPREPAKPIPPSDPVPASTPAPGAALEEVGSKPETLDAPRDGSGDDLQRIKGVGPKLAGQLNEAGIYHFDQIASWSADEVAWIEFNVDGAKGRITRDDWVAQARTLAGG